MIMTDFHILMASDDENYFVSGTLSPRDVKVAVECGVKHKG